VLIDAHAHLDLEHYEADRNQTIERAKANGIERIINVGIESSRWQNSLELARQNQGYIYLALGLHPNDINREQNPAEALRYLEKLVVDNPNIIVAIGETGLDYYHKDTTRELQEEYFLKQIELARRLKLPLVIHCRDAMADTLALLRRYARQLPIMMHCFTGTPQEALACLELGERVYISLAGPVTYKNAHERHQVAGIVPLNRLLLETDCPFLTPHPFRGRRNEPAYVRFVAEKIAEIKAISYDEVVHITGGNVKELFGIQ